MKQLIALVVVTMAIALGGQWTAIILVAPHDSQTSPAVTRRAPSSPQARCTARRCREGGARRAPSPVRRLREGG